MTAGDSLTIDESMVKAYRHGLKGKMKIIRKPRPIVNKLCDARSMIVFNKELHEGREELQSKDGVKEYGVGHMCNNFAPNQTLERIFKNRLWRFMVRLGENGHRPNEGKRPLCQHVGKNGAQALSLSSTGPEAYSAWRVECGGRDKQGI